MSKGLLIGVICAAVVGVAALAVLTPTVIVNGGGPSRERISIVGSAPVVPGPQTGPLGELGNCLRSHGLGLQDRGTMPDLKTMRDAMKACRGTMPGMPSGR